MTFSAPPKVGYALVPERSMTSNEASLLSGTSVASQVHAAAVNGNKRTLQKLIAGNSDLKDKEDQFGRTPLMYCVLADRMDCAEALLKAGANVNKADRSQRTALHLAAQKGNYRFMKLLLARKANWMQKDLEEMTPLHLATRHKNPKCLALLLKVMAPGEVDTQDRNKQTALHWSAYYNHPEHVKFLIKHDSNIGIPDIEGKIPLHWAANNKYPSAVHTIKCILDAAPTESLLNWQDYEGRTPLHFAVADGNEAVVNVLTSYEGCNITTYDNLFRTPLHWAALLGHAQIVHLLLERNKSGTIPSDSQGATPLHYASQSNFAETVKVFLKHPSVKDDSDLEGRTAFMWAAGKGSEDVIRTMLNLKHDFDLNMADKYGGTALHAAALSGHASTVKLLLDHGAQVDAADVMKHTPLFRGCEMGQREVIQTLIKGGARVDLVDQDGHSPLHWAALRGNANVCQILIENKINPNVQDYAGRTPLQCAAHGGYINCMAVLMENKADPNIQDKEGRTALHWSCNNGYLDAVKLLLGFSAFPNQMENSEERYTPLDYALLGEHHEVIQFMLEHGALSIAAIQDIAASKIQAVYKGYKVRKAFKERKNLLMKHEQLRKDAAAKKREEENKKKETRLQKEIQNQMDLVQETHQHLENIEKFDRCPNSSPVAGKPSDKYGENLKSQAELNKIDSFPPFEKKSSPKSQVQSAEFHTEDSKRKKEFSRKRSKGKLTSLYKDGDDKQKTPDATSVSLTSKDEKCKDPVTKINSASSCGNRSSVSSNKSYTNNTREMLQDQIQTDSNGHFEKMIKELEHISFSDGNLRTSRSCENGKSKSKPKQVKAMSKEVNGERCSPAGSSRPGSARIGFVNTGSLSAKVHARRMTTNELESNAHPMLSTDAESKSLESGNLAVETSSNNVLNSGKPERMKYQNSDDQLCMPLTQQSLNVEIIPIEVRLQIIKKERARKETFRKKNHAAALIQRTWRRYQLRQELFQLLRAKKQSKDEDTKWKREAAAFIIQVIWKKQLNHSPPKPVSSYKNPKSMSRSFPTKGSKQPSTLKQIYGNCQEGKWGHPSRHSSKHKLSTRDLISESNLRYINLLDVTWTTKKFSYNMGQASSAKTKPKKPEGTNEVR
ncbi:inversin [Microcaecilia unicolor]|uniref:Inversin n=1 Tax=Microcaecilia unicolor TaxID=1415580 RepID=A0A6P7Y7M7_9AMPH|nr:inversin [Microcaecilia unicolor]